MLIRIESTAPTTIPILVGSAGNNFSADSTVSRTFSGNLLLTPKSVVLIDDHRINEGQLYNLSKKDCSRLSGSQHRSSQHRRHQ